MAFCDSLELELPTAKLPESCQNPNPEQPPTKIEMDLKMEPPTEKFPESCQNQNPEQPPTKIEMDVDVDVSITSAGRDARKMRQMELRSGKKLLPFTPGTKFARPKQVKRKPRNLYVPCSQCNKYSPPRVDFWAKFGYDIIEEEQPTNCGCPGEDLGKIYRYILKDRSQKGPKRYFDPPGVSIRGGKS